MSNNKQSSVEWLVGKFSRVLRDTHFSDEQNFNMIKYIEQAKAMHREEHGQTWDKSLDNLKARGMNEMRAYTDFDDYYAEKFGGDK